MKQLIILFIITLFSTVGELHGQKVFQDSILCSPYKLKNNFKNAPLEIDLPGDSFTISFCVLDHVNHPIGFNLWDNKGQLFFQYKNNQIKRLGEKNKQLTGAFKNYWHQLVLIYQDQQLSVYHNGVKVLKRKQVQKLDNWQLKLTGDLGNEPYMQLKDLIKTFTVYQSPLQEAAIEQNFQNLTDLIDQGKLPGDTATYLVGPFLTFPTSESVQVTWETQEPATAIVRYGTTYPLMQTQKIEEPNTIQHIRLSNLEAGTNYFAEVELLGSDKLADRVQLSFKTAPLDLQALRFAVIGDTESRPFINAQLGKLIWGDRPDFFLLCGDVTDGGQQAFKNQWTQEFFSGTSALMQRVPLVPAAGNGDSDLYWFNRYFNPPSDDGYYSFQWSNAEFFILNSNLTDQLAPDNSQYRWLEDKLKNSQATWKFIVLHYAPYSSDEDDYGDSYKGTSTWGDPNMQKLIPLFEQYRVDMVLYGHLHCYERSWPILHNQVVNQGVVYVETGGAGGNLEDFAPHRSWFSAKTFRGHHYVMVNVFNQQLRMDTYNIEGQLIDTYELKHK